MTALRLIDVGVDLPDTGTVLDGVHLDVPTGQLVAVVGTSGAGKSTLLAAIGGLRPITRGRILIGDVELGDLDERHRLRLRATAVGIAVQNPYRNLLAYASAVDNVWFAQQGARSAGARDLEAPLALLDRLGLASLAGTRVDALSGGERQRLALVAAVASAPGLLLADEPTSQLDAGNRDEVVSLLHLLRAELGTTVVVVTHDAEVAGRFDRVVRITDGRLTEEVG